MKRLVQDLHEVAYDLDRARNAMAEAWLLWRRLHPEWQAPPVLDSKGQPKLTKKGEPILLSPMHPLRVDDAGNVCGSDEGTGFETYLYHQGRKAAPNVAAILMSSACQEVLSNLKTDVQRHQGKAKYRWQAVLTHEESMPTFRARTIPVPNNSSIFCYAGVTTGKGSKADRDLAEFWGKSGAVLCFPLFAADASRKTRCPIATLGIGRLSPGNRKVLKRVVRGEWKFRDSKLVCKKDRWQIQLTYQQEGQSLELAKERTAVLWPQFPEAARPFLVETIGDDGAAGSRRWQCGNGLWLAAEFDRLDTRRKRIRNRYRVATSGVKGHGQKRFEMRLKPWARKTHNCQRHFTWQLIAEVVRFCRANDCGKVVYREPTLPLRDWLWLGKRGVPYDWTGLETNLAHKLRYYGIELVKERVGAKELRERFGGENGDWQSGSQVPSPKGNSPNDRGNGSRVPQGDNGARSAANGNGRSRFLGARKR